MIDAPQSKHFIDATRLLCPMPVIKLQNLVRNCKTQDRIEILCSDPGTQHDIPTWCRIHGHTLEAVLQPEKAQWQFNIIVK